MKKGIYQRKMLPGTGECHIYIYEHLSEHSNKYLYKYLDEHIYECLCLYEHFMKIHMNNNSLSTLTTTNLST